MAATVPAEVPDLPLQKSKGEWAVEARTFRLSTGEAISLYGVRRRRFAGANFYAGEAGAGALTGRRGGYFEGGGAVGVQAAPFQACRSEAYVFSGAAGGGGVQEGGGWLVRPTLALGVAWTPGLHAAAEAGYARFMNGNLRGWTFALSFTYAFWDIQ
ncbi:MAG: hypothetical protein K0Q91_2182 [Fibrobacteria bacterium]|nr:hypothetical protein [Fibrobacteria bacterium]